MRCDGPFNESCLYYQAHNYITQANLRYITHNLYFNISYTGLPCSAAPTKY